MTSERTEEEILLQTGTIVILGGTQYDIPPLVIREAREWRKKVINLITPVPAMSKVNTDNPEDFGAALEQMLVTQPDQVIELFFDYAKLDREEIEGKATDAELAIAFQELIKVCFSPLAEAPLKVMGRLSQ